MPDQISAAILAPTALLGGLLIVAVLVIGWLSSDRDRLRNRVQDLYAENRSLKEGRHG